MKAIYNTIFFILLLISFFIIDYSNKQYVIIMLLFLIIANLYRKKYAIYLIFICISISYIAINKINDINKKPFLRAHINNIYNELDKKEVLTENDIKSIEKADIKNIEKVLYKKINESPLHKVNFDLHDINFYMDLCLFFKEKECVLSSLYQLKSFYFIRVFNTDEMTNKRIRKNDNDILKWYQKTYFIPYSKEDLLLYGYYDIDIQENNCLHLFYGVQNGWGKYKEKLIKNLKNKTECSNELINKLEWISKDKYENMKEAEIKKEKEELKEELIKFLISLKVE